MRWPFQSNNVNWKPPPKVKKGALIYLFILSSLSIVRGKLNKRRFAFPIGLEAVDQKCVLCRPFIFPDCNDLFSHSLAWWWWWRRRRRLICIFFDTKETLSGQRFIQRGILGSHAQNAKVLTTKNIYNGWWGPKKAMITTQLEAARNIQAKDLPIINTIASVISRNLA